MWIFMIDVNALKKYALRFNVLWTYKHIRFIEDAGGAFPHFILSSIYKHFFLLLLPHCFATHLDSWIDRQCGIYCCCGLFYVLRFCWCYFFSFFFIFRLFFFLACLDRRTRAIVEPPKVVFYELLLCSIECWTNGLSYNWNTTASLHFSIELSSLLTQFIQWTKDGACKCAER